MNQHEVDNGGLNIATPKHNSHTCVVVNLIIHTVHIVNTFLITKVEVQGRQDLNPRPTALKAAILPTELLPLDTLNFYYSRMWVILI